MSERKRVGGRIFFIDDTSSEKVRFFDRVGKEIPSVSIGDAPYEYEVVSQGDKPKYWVYSNRTERLACWSSIYELIGTSTGFGAGAENTQKILNAGNKDLCDLITKVRQEKYKGCDDWFIPSKNELEVLRVFFYSLEELDLINPFDMACIWSSSEQSVPYSWYWDCDFQDWLTSNKYYNYSVFFLRTF